MLTRGNLLRDFMLAAYDLNMHVNGDYTFLAIELIKSKKAEAIEWLEFQFQFLFYFVFSF